MKFNRTRIWLGGLAGGVIWNAWSFFVYRFITGERYLVAQQAGLFLKTPRYPMFVVQWTVMLFVLSIAVAHLRLVAQGLGRWPGNRIESWVYRGIFCRLSGRIRAGDVVRRRPNPALWMDGGNVAGSDSGSAGRRLALQRLAHEISPRHQDRCKIISCYSIFTLPVPQTRPCRKPAPR